MTDRELLELAAKAIGKPLQLAIGSSDKEWAFFGENGREWNPLDYDGDSRQLQVALYIDLRFDVDPDSAETFSEASATWDDAPAPIKVPFDQCGNKSARRAVLQFAAEIGKAMR